MLIVAGALVTSNDAGLAVPDWPTSFGSLYRIPPMVGGVQYEHGHRMIAQFVGLVTIAFAVWAQRAEPRAWMRKLGWWALALVIVQGILGGITVLTFLPWYVSTLHALLAQTFFSLTFLLIVFTGRRWLADASSPTIDQSRISLRALGGLGIASVYLQLFLGGAFRHGGMHFWPHLVGAAVATAVLLWLAIQALTSFPQVKAIRGAAIAVLALLVSQLGLGFAAYVTRVEWGREAAQPLPSMVWSTVAHVAVGALLLAHVFLLTVHAYRHTTVAVTERASEAKAVIA